MKNLKEKRKLKNPKRRQLNTIVFLFCRFPKLKNDLVGVLLRQLAYANLKNFITRNIPPDSIWHYAQKGIADFMHNAQGQRIATPTEHIVQNTQYTAGQIVQKVEHL